MYLQTKKGHKFLAVLIAFTMILTMLGSMTSTAFAAEASTEDASVTVSYIDKAGEEQNIDSWYYDATNKTYRVGSATGTKLSLVKDFSTYAGVAAYNKTLADYLKDKNVGYAMPFTGINKKPDPRCLAITKKGIVIEEMLEYYGKKLGVDLKGDTLTYLATSDGFKDEFTYEQYWGLTKFFYPDWYAAETLQKTFEDSYTSGDTTTGTVYKGYKVPTLLAIEGYHGTTNADLATLIQNADDKNALRITSGQQVGGNTKIEGSDWADVNQGNLSVNNVARIKFTPEYHAITVKNGTVDGTEGKSDYQYKMDHSTVTTADNYFKAAAGEQVTLTVTPDENYGVEKVVVGGKEVAGNGDTYTFTMAKADVDVEITVASTIDIAWYDAAKNNFELSTAAQLKGFAAIVNGTATDAEGKAIKDNFAGKTVTLANDIAVDEDGLYTAKENVVYGAISYPMTVTQYVLKEDAMVWTPIGKGTATSNINATTENAFAGTFDGNNHKISGIYTGTKDAKAGNKDTVQGLFGVVSGTVKNVTVSGCITGKMVMGGIAAQLMGGTIDNCTNEAIVFADGGTTPAGNKEDGTSKMGAVAGIVGNVMNTCTVTNCKNSADVTCANTNRGGRTGGIIGLIDGQYEVTIQKNANTGDINAYQYIGGIVGVNFSKTAPIKECYNTGMVTGNSSGSTYVGGIVSQCYSDISDCYNTGDFVIHNSGKSAHNAGISSDFFGTAITNCYNTGKCLKEGSSYGGICGSGYGNKPESSKIATCYTIEGTAYENKEYVTELSKDEMQSLSFAKALGDTFAFNPNAVAGNDGYPVLNWQIDAMDNKQDIVAATDMTEKLETGIKEIGRVTLSDAAVAKKLRAEYDAMSNEAKALISEELLKEFEEIEATIADLQDNANVVKAVAKVENKIEAIGKVTVDSEDAITAARAAYDKLSDSEKELVENLDVLEKAEADLKVAKEEAEAKAKAEAEEKAKAEAAAKAKAEKIKKAEATKVTNVKVAAGKKKATVSWKKVSGVTGYKVYRSTKKTSGFKLVKTVTKSSTVKYTNTNLTKGKTYYYKVRTYTKIDGKIYYGKYSTVKNVKVK